MSRADKLSAMQQLMMESNDIWTLKELEKDCPKKKGIPSMTVKEILQELCDCDLVSFDKIGSSNYYWCFASEACNRRTVETENLTKQAADLTKEIQNLQGEIKELEPGREESEERVLIDVEISEFLREIEEIKKSAEKYQQFNPEYLKGLEVKSQIAFDSANRWTDNIFACRSYAKKTFNLLPEKFTAVFEIQEDFDYLE
ncbi:Mnd1 family protein [Tritrichomonas foetus]|uniref:Mnd1 family protein n=1 Tax=Tritrichomonas foetus TaxID=1144522 RepID=A0A1J4JWS2_9EUKA|nr:Mnd1 family protein [Tritrichomonas foetus]|eukprot:OHT02904.1 Mnd1 family protein [Tritrichomonas foetus]